MLGSRLAVPLVLLVIALVYYALFNNTGWKHGAQFLDDSNRQAFQNTATTPLPTRTPSATPSTPVVSEPEPNLNSNPNPDKNAQNTATTATPTTAPIDSTPTPEGRLAVVAEVPAEGSTPDAKVRAAYALPTGKPVLTAYMSHMPYDPATPYFATAMFVYTSLYASRWGYPFTYYVAPEEAPVQSPDQKLPGCGKKKYCRDKECHQRACMGPDGCLLHPVWCKVKAMARVLRDNPTSPYAVMLDTDSHIAFEFFQTDLVSWTEGLLQKTGFPLDEAPVVFNQEQPTWWVMFTEKHNNSLNTKNVSYRWVINTGTYVVGNSERGRELIDTWWNSSMGNYKDNPIGFKYREEWPWEQDRAMAMMNEWELPGVQVVPQRSRPMQLDRAHRDRIAGRGGECFSATAVFRCFVNHFCADGNMKKDWGNRVMHFSLAILHVCTTGNPLTVVVEEGPHDAKKPAFPQTFEITADSAWCSETAKALPKEFPRAVSRVIHEFESPNEEEESVRQIRAAAKIFAAEYTKELP